MAEAGITQSERFLNRLATFGFLKLWCHPNVYRKKSKELCDLLVICHNKVIIFSDKTVSFSDIDNTNVSWQRWYNRAVNHSSKQLKRAKGWIENHRNRIFSDAQCNNRITLIDDIQENLEIHLVSISNGSADPCIEYFGGGSGSLIIDPNQDPLNPEPFHVGNPGGNDLFIHVFSEANINVLMQELDTITDFTDYLLARQKVFENSNLTISASEEDLLSVYLRDVNEKGNHDFVIKSGESLKENENFAVGEGAYLAYRKHPAYRRKKIADRVSYAWDRLIESFASNFLSGNLEQPPPEFAEFDGSKGGVEMSLRFMALEGRVHRRSHAAAIRGAFVTLKSTKSNRFFRAMLPDAESASTVGFFILLVNRSFAHDKSYDEYRKFRTLNAHGYATNLLKNYPHLRRVVGIATEGEIGKGRSEDLIYYEQKEWTDEDIQEAEDFAKHFDIFANLTPSKPTHSEEYPQSDVGIRGGFAPIPYRFVSRDRPVEMARSTTGNRRQRRAAKAKARNK